MTVILSQPKCITTAGINLNSQDIWDVMLTLHIVNNRANNCSIVKWLYAYDILYH